MNTEATASYRPRAVWGWMFCDWASQPFYTLVMTFIFAPYFVASVASSPAEGQEIWGYAVSAGSLLIALTAPLLGAAADAGGRRRPWIIVFSLIFIAGSCGLWLAEPGADPVSVLVFFVVALIGVEFTAIFTNSLLPLLGPEKELGRISGSGWAMGYWGGLLSLFLVLGFIAPAPGSDLTILGLAPAFGIDPAKGEDARVTGLFTALWYVIFMIPFFFWAPDAPRAAGNISDGPRQLWRSLSTMDLRGRFFRFLLGSMLYRDGLNGLYFFGGVYAAGVLGWGLFDLAKFGIVGALAGALGAWAGGRADRAYGPRVVIMATIVALILACFAGMSTAPGEALFIPVGSAEAPSALPDLIFMICGALIGAAGGALQSASRTMLIRIADSERMTEAFGLYALAGKGTGFLAPLMIAVATGLADSQRAGMAPVAVFLVLGLWVMRRIRA